MLLIAGAEFTQMPPLVETLKAAVGTIFRDRDGHQRTLLLMPHLTDEEFRRLEASVACPIPEEAGVLLQYARGFQMPNLQNDPNRLLTEFDWSGLEGAVGRE